MSEVLVGLLGVRGGGVVERDTEVYKDKERYFLRIPVELVESLDVHEKKRTEQFNFSMPGYASLSGLMIYLS